MFSEQTLKKFENTETPFYYYDLNLLRQTLQACKQAADRYNYHVHYALKANFNPAVLEAVQATGFGADCVSGNEVKAAIAHQFTASKIVFAGVGKSDKEINAALDADIFCFNVESVQELVVINDLAIAKNKTAKVAIRINPNVDAHTHRFITTGLDENKFGINTWQLDDVVFTLGNSTNLQFIGIHFHIGSQITELDVFKDLCVKANELSEWFEQRGLNVQVLNVGGGLGIDYRTHEAQPVADFDNYFRIFNENLIVKEGQEVHFELGRSLVAHSASLIARVLYVKNGINKNFLVLDAGMTELIRPMLYQAYHQIENLSKTVDEGKKMVGYDVVGPICESTDCFQTDVQLPESQRGDLLAIRTAGAYGEVMASGYNLRDRVQSIYSDAE
ncbi:diaminopimelate decarboxylase [Mucilaginibacter koreensis]